MQDCLIGQDGLPLAVAIVMFQSASPARVNNLLNLVTCAAIFCSCRMNLMPCRTLLQGFYSTLRSQKTSSGKIGGSKVTSLCVLNAPMNAYSEN